VGDALAWRDGFGALRVRVLGKLRAWCRAEGAPAGTTTPGLVSIRGDDGARESCFEHPTPTYGY